LQLARSPSSLRTRRACRTWPRCLSRRKYIIQDVCILPMHCIQGVGVKSTTESNLQVRDASPGSHFASGLSVGTRLSSAWPATHVLHLLFFYI
jgi:hypothetical protein